MLRRKKKNPGFKNFLTNTVFGNVEGNKYEVNPDEKKNVPSASYIPKNSNTQTHSKSK